MSVAWSVQEVYEVEIQIEKNGAAFYRKAAKRFSERAVRDTLNELAAMEDEHRETFEVMRAALPEDADSVQWNDPEGEAVRYLQAFASGQVFDVTRNPSAALGDTTGPGEILMMAIGKERDSIMFYLGLKQLLRARPDCDQLNGIIKEEMGHITVLIDQIELYGGA